MVNALLYAATVAIWGSTWLVITFQLRDAPPTTAVGWRFLVAGMIMLAWCLARGVSLRFSPRHTLQMVLQGIAIFACNYWLIYLAEARIPSGLVAVVFSMLMVFNMIGGKLVFGQKITGRAALGALSGVVGVALVFWPEIRRLEGGVSALIGIALALGGTLVASIGNLMSVRTRQMGIGVVPSITVGMSAGGVFMLAVAAIGGDGVSIPLTTSFWLPLLYLSIAGSIIAFAAYFHLINRIGAARASYNGVVIPIVALALSTLFEGYRWEMASVVGVLLSVMGNVLVMRGKDTPPEEK